MPVMYHTNLRVDTLSCRPASAGDKVSATIDIESILTRMRCAKVR